MEVEPQNNVESSFMWPYFPLPFLASRSKTDEGESDRLEPLDSLDESLEFVKLETNFL